LLHQRTEFLSLPGSHWHARRRLRRPPASG
jgi:hypothetical protein